MKKVKPTCVLGVPVAEADYSLWTKGKVEGLRPLAGLTLNCCSIHSHIWSLSRAAKKLNIFLPLRMWSENYCSLSTLTFKKCGKT